MESNKKNFIKTKLKDFLSEQIVNVDLDLSKDYAIQNLFYKYEREYEDEYNEDNWVKFHYGSERKGGVNALKESLELIGDGEITDKGNKSFMYKEMLKDDSLILVVHGSLQKSTYGGMEGYKYSLGVYRNNPRRQQIGGGYGTSGIMSIEHTRLLSYDDYDIVHHNRNIISKVCNDIKKYAVENF
jgi:hypothetical protein